MNVVSLGVSTSQTLLLVITALSLLVLTVLLWKNHRTLLDRAARPLVVLARNGVSSPADLVSWPTQTIPVRAPARAPPTFYLPLTRLRAERPGASGNVPMPRYVTPKTAD